MVGTVCTKAYQWYTQKNKKQLQKYLKNKKKLDYVFKLEININLL